MMSAEIQVVAVTLVAFLSVLVYSLRLLPLMAPR